MVNLHRVLDAARLEWFPTKKVPAGAFNASAACLAKCVGVCMESLITATTPALTSDDALTQKTSNLMARGLALIGCGCLLVVVFAHVAERFDIFPFMGWGLPDSPGHYLDLFSAIAGVALLLGSLAARWVSD